MFSRRRFSCSALSLRRRCRQNLPLQLGRLWQPPTDPPPPSAEAKLTLGGGRWALDGWGCAKLPTAVAQYNNRQKTSRSRLSGFWRFLLRSGWTADGLSRFEAVYEWPSKREINIRIKMPGLMRHQWEMQHSSSTLIPSDGRLTNRSVYRQATNETYWHISKKSDTLFHFKCQHRYIKRLLHKDYERSKTV